jgi:hypothetical protein
LIIGKSYIKQKTLLLKERFLFNIVGSTQLFADAFNWANGRALRFVVVTFAFYAFSRIDFVFVVACGDSLYWAFCFASAAVDAIFGNCKRHDALLKLY